MVSEGRLQPVAFPSLTDLNLLTPPGGEGMKLWGDYTYFYDLRQFSATVLLGLIVLI